MTSSLYIHIPFCTNKCDYCDFYSLPVKGLSVGLTDTFTDAVLGDINEQLEFFNVDHIPTVYMGGGTPSALGEKTIGRLLSGLQALLQKMKKPPVEFTIEANPESADDDFLRVCADSGINRISLGVQTFNEMPRRAVHRAGGSAMLEQRLASAAAYFPDSLSVDLITGLPFQTADMVLNDIEHLLLFKPVHISLYSLILEPETALGRQYNAAKVSLPCGDDADNLWVTGRNRLEAGGLAQYEVSNFSLPGKACVHNIRYWRMENWLGAGPAASGTIIDNETGTGRRYTYPEDINAYLAGAKPRIEEINRAALIRESLLMGFRYRAGPDPLLFKQRFGCSIEDCIPKTIARWRERGFFESNKNSNCTVSRKGLLFLNGFLRDAFNELG